MRSYKSKEFLRTNIASNLPNNILHLMQKRKISESELARAIMLPYNTVKRITTGETTDPKISTLSLIADFFGVGIDTLLRGVS